MSGMETMLPPESTPDRKPRGLNEVIAVAEERFRKIEAHRLSKKRLIQTATELIKQNYGGVADIAVFPELNRIGKAHTDTGEGYLLARLKLDEEIAIAIGFHGIGVIKQEGGLAALTGVKLRREILSRDQLRKMIEQRNGQWGTDMLKKIVSHGGEEKAGDIHFSSQTLVISDKKGEVVIRLTALDDFQDDGENILELRPPGKASERFSFENLGLGIEERTVIYGDLTTKLASFLRREPDVAA